MIAIIRTGGKQYLVKPNQSLEIEKLEAKEGDSVNFEVLLTADEAGKTVDIGTPTAKGKVTGKVMKHYKGKKVDVIKFKSKVRYSRKYGHRQPYTTVQIESIV